MLQAANYFRTEHHCKGRQAGAACLATVCRDVAGHTKWGFPKIRGTFLGVPIIRTIIYWGLYWGTLFWETTK